MLYFLIPPLLLDMLINTLEALSKYLAVANESSGRIKLQIKQSLRDKSQKGSRGEDTQDTGNNGSTGAGVNFKKPRRIIRKGN